jgi:type VI secretion system protein ImpF
MARGAPEANVTASVLDRLLDLEPALAVDPPVSRFQSLRLLRAALKRDLEWLLNTRRNPLPPPEGSEELKRSLYDYGLPDVTALGIHSVNDQKRLLRMLEATVALFEPRISGATVSMEPVAGKTHVLRFQIQGLLMVDPAPEKVAFDTVLELTRGEYEVRAE